MSDGEVFVLLGSVIVALIGLVRWLVPSLRAHCGRRGAAARWLVLAAAAAGTAILFVMLRAWASFDVRDSTRYLCLYVALGAAWWCAGAWLLGFLGVHFRDDVVERNNPAAALATAGFLLGLLACYAGGNIGDGPGWWVVVFCALLGGTTQFLGWTFLNLTGRAWERVTIERDVAAGLRLGVLFVATGLVLGRSVAGNWVSADAALRDFARQAWPALMLFPVEAALLAIVRPGPDQPRPPLSLGLPPALLYLGGAILYVRALGPW